MTHLDLSLAATLDFKPAIPFYTNLRAADQEGSWCDCSTYESVSLLFVTSTGDRREPPVIAFRQSAALENRATARGGMPAGLAGVDPRDLAVREYRYKAGSPGFFVSGSRANADWRSVELAEPAAEITFADLAQPEAMVLVEVYSRTRNPSLAQGNRWAGCVVRDIGARPRRGSATWIGVKKRQSLPEVTMDLL